MPAIYLDHHATTPVDPRVLEAMLPYFTSKPGNPASRSHSFGWEADRAVERARQRIAALAGGTAREIVFTSGATESNNLALKGAAEAYRRKGNHLVTMATEHKAVLDTVRHLEHAGFRVTVLPPEPDGLLDVARLRAAILPETILVSVMYANNEIGAVQPVREIGEICRQSGVLFHCDAAQALGKIPVDVEAAHIDLLSVSAHKMYGPKGVGALYVRRRNPRVELMAQIHGGGHESGMRSGTLNVPGIVGFGEACAIAAEEMAGEAVRIAALRDSLLRQLAANLENGGGPVHINGTMSINGAIHINGSIHINGTMTHRLPGNLNVSFEGVDGDALLTSIPEIAVSAGSACGSGYDSSYVLEALGLSSALLQCPVRFGIGRSNTQAEIDYAASQVAAAVIELRTLSPVL
jgi:cysteine desulfurase